MGYLLGGGYNGYSSSYNSVSNYTSHGYPSSWPYILWVDIDNYAGAELNITVHRGTNSSKTYNYYHTILGGESTTGSN